MGRKKADENILSAAEAEERRNDLEAAFVEQMAVLMVRKQELANDLKELSDHIKDTGLSPKVIKAVAARQMEDEDAAEDRRAFELARDVLLSRLGEFSNTALGRAALAA